MHHLVYVELSVPVDDCCHDQESPGVLAMRACPGTNLFGGQTGLACPPIEEH